MRNLLVFAVLISATSWAVSCPVKVRKMARAQNFPQWRERALALPATTPRPARTDLPVLIVGAGPAGLAATKSLLRAGIACECIERGPGFGGLWNTSNPHSPAYDALKTNSSKATTHLGDPVDDAFPDYLSNADALEYLVGFAHRHGLDKVTRFKTSVDKLEQLPDGSWLATLRDELGQVSSRQYRAVVAASGRQSIESSRIPKDLWDAARANGIGVSHSSTYRNAEEFVGKRVLIVGIGNSGAEISTEISWVAKTVVSMRSVPWVVPEYVGNTPADKFAETTPWWLPNWLEHLAFNLIVRWYVGHPETIGLGTPDHALLEKLPIAERGIKEAIRSKRLKVVSNIESIEDGLVHFRNPFDPPAAFDHILFATGYNLEYPYLPEGTIDAQDPNLELPFWVFHRNNPNLLFMHEVGVAQGVWPMFAAQGELAAAYFQAQNGQTDNHARLLQMLPEPNPDFRGKVFRLAGPDYLDAKTYAGWLGELTRWLRQ
jgi:hypothetical protein